MSLKEFEGGFIALGAVAIVLGLVAITNKYRTKPVESVQDGYPNPTVPHTYNADSNGTTSGGMKRRKKSRKNNVIYYVNKTCRR